MGMIERFESMLAAGQDTPLLRFGLGTALFNAGDWAGAITHLREALRQDPAYSAAWKWLGRALLEGGQAAEAVQVLGEGIEVAEGRGDIQAAKEMRVFRRRAERQVSESHP